MKVKWLHHIVDVWLLWSLWAYCIKGGKTRMTKSQFVQALNLIGWEGGASFLDQSHGEVKKNQSNHWLLSTLNWKMLCYMYNATLKKIYTDIYNYIFSRSGSRGWAAFKSLDLKAFRKTQSSTHGMLFRKTQFGPICDCASYPQTSRDASVLSVACKLPPESWLGWDDFDWLDW